MVCDGWRWPPPAQPLSYPPASAEKKSLIFYVITSLYKQISVPSKFSQNMINLVFIPDIL